MFKRLLLGVLSAGSLFAYNHPCPNQWQLSGEFLYLLPSVDDTYYVLSSSITADYPTGTRANNDFSFQPGFRVGAEYSMCDPQREFQVYYTYLGAEQNGSVSGTHLSATLGTPNFVETYLNYSGKANSSLHLLYQRLDFTYAQQILNSAGLYVYLEPALELAYLRYDQNYIYKITGGDKGTVQQNSKVEGIGPQLGCEFGYDFYKYAPAPATSKSSKGNAVMNCISSATHTLSLSGMFSGSLLASWNETSESAISSGSTYLSVTDQSTWRVIPALHARAGFNYDVRFSSVGFALGVGYEFDSYIRGVAKPFFSDDGSPMFSTNNYTNFDVQGLYVSGAISF